MSIKGNALLVICAWGIVVFVTLWMVGIVPLDNPSPISPFNLAVGLGLVGSAAVIKELREFGFRKVTLLRILTHTVEWFLLALAAAYLLDPLV